MASTYTTDVTDENRSGLTVVNVAHREGVAEIAEHTRCQTERIRADEADLVLVTQCVQQFLFFVHQIGDNDHLFPRRRICSKHETPSGNPP